MSAKSARLRRRRRRKAHGDRKIRVPTWSETLTVIVSLVLAAILAVTASKARACDLALTQSPNTVVINYNPFAAGPSSGAIDLGLKNQTDEACELRLSFVDDGGAIVSRLDLGGVGCSFVRERRRGFRRLTSSLGSCATLSQARRQVRRSWTPPSSWTPCPTQEPTPAT